MTPEQLAQWLLQAYGAAYQGDIAKLKSYGMSTSKTTILLTDLVSIIIGKLINGELFLSLPDDAELLQELNLSLAFKRLVVGKAKQVDTY